MCTVCFSLVVKRFEIPKALYKFPSIIIITYVAERTELSGAAVVVAVMVTIQSLGRSRRRRVRPIPGSSGERLLRQDQRSVVP